MQRTGERETERQSAGESKRERQRDRVQERARERARETECKRESERERGDIDKVSMTMQMKNHSYKDMVELVMGRKRRGERGSHHPR